MPLTAEEMAEIVKGVGTTVNNLLDERLNPVTTVIEEIKVNQTKINESFAANANREESEMRKVVIEAHGELIGNSLKGEDLVKVFKECGSSAPLNGNTSQSPLNKGSLGVPKVDDGYFRVDK